MWEFLLTLLCGFLGICREPTHCRDIQYAQVEHIVCSFRADEVSVRVHLNDETGRPYARLSSLKGVLSTDPLMLMNGGMYHDDLSPVGLYVEAGEKAQSLSTKDGWGNFHLLPNGVFWVKNGRASVTETRAFARRKIRPDMATQSGPMLVIDGKLHPRFLKDSDSLKIRNGVGVSKDGSMLHFAISRRPINFWNFGHLFQRELKAHNALFLDGTVSSIQADGFSQSGWKSIGPIISVLPKNG
ncbi:MAG: phosphodiester glycosidase family protein [Ahrensia sp.]|nr:phosphodiester glycosidase family protein [Ahrensia sp.]